MRLRRCVPAAARHARNWRVLLWRQPLVASVAAAAAALQPLWASAGLRRGLPGLGAECEQAVPAQRPGLAGAVVRAPQVGRAQAPVERRVLCWRWEAEEAQQGGAGGWRGAPQPGAARQEARRALEGGAQVHPPAQEAEGHGVRRGGCAAGVARGAGRGRLQARGRAGAAAAAAGVGAAVAADMWFAAAAADAARWRHRAWAVAEPLAVVGEGAQQCCPAPHAEGSAGS